MTLGKGFDSGSAGFRVVVDHVAGVLGQPVVNASSLDSPCFPAPAGEPELPAMPNMVLHFAGGADMRLHRDNYMYFYPESSSFCLSRVLVGFFFRSGQFPAA